MKNLTFYLSILLLFIGFIACEENEVEINDNEPQNKELAKDVITIDCLHNPFYFTEDSIDQISFPETHTIGTSCLLNALGHGRGSDGSIKQWILDLYNFSWPEVEDSITELTLDEKETKLVLLSWDGEKITNKLNLIQDSLYKLYSIPLNERTNFEYINEYNKNNPLCIYINLINIKKLGQVDLLYKNKNIQPYLIYKSSLFSDKDSIPLTPFQFHNIYGDEFTTSLSLGKSMMFQSYVSGFDCKEETKHHVMAELVAIFQDPANYDKSWDEVKQHTKYFKNAYFITNHFSGRGNYHCFSISLFDQLKSINEMVKQYRASEFYVLSYTKTPYHQLYPTFEFEPIIE